MAVTLTELYRQTTGDHDSHPNAIAAQLRRIDPRRQAWIRARLAGHSWRDIAAPAGIAHGTVARAVQTALRTMRKAIAGEPRYNRQGRKPYGKRTATP